jgi:hypothetical protein
MKCFDFGRWTTTKAALAVAVALAIAGAVGSAVAFSPMIVPPIKWQGGWEARGYTYNYVGQLITTVPAERSLIITDIVASNLSSTVGSFKIYEGSSDCSTSTAERFSTVMVLPSSSFHVPLQTGIGFGAGKRVCFSIIGTSMSFNFRGFFFTPS